MLTILVNHRVISLAQNHVLRNDENRTINVPVIILSSTLIYDFLPSIHYILHYAMMCVTNFGLY